MPQQRPIRLSTNLTGVYRTPRGFECEVDVDDLSLGGCRVDDVRGGLRLGEYVQITLREAGPFVAEVAWRQSTRVGLQFNRPIPAHVLEALTGVDVTAPAESAPVPDPAGPAIPQPFEAPPASSPVAPESATHSANLRRFL
ncbi:MAG: PilZ domain-containing protein [Erythrobacter sp.]|nr:PilZ domain-containing protein [Erythrobacter sp.]